MKRRRHRLERAARWGCTALAVLLAGIWGFSSRRSLLCISPASTAGQYVACIVHGGILYLEFGQERQPGGSRSWALSIETNYPKGRSVWIHEWLPGVVRDPTFWGLSAPLWIPFVVIVVASVWLWVRFLHRRTRVRAGLVCPECLYSRLGLAPSAPCPECGTRRTPEAAG